MNNLSQFTNDDSQRAYQAMIERTARDPQRYTEPLRPQFHYTPIEGWMNDPNGLCFFNGEWHLFMQHSGWFMQPIGWGHVVSKDLLQWEHRVPALAPDEKGAIWSGSAVVDWHDSSGFFGGKPGLVCIYTYMNPAENGRQSQGIAFSADGDTFTKYERNPIIPQLRHQPGQPDEADFRDPKVFWHEPTQRWVMIVAGGKVRFFSSPNLRDWRFESINADIQTECPDLFLLALDGDAAQTKWVLNGGGRWYLIGAFDGHIFTPQSGRIPLNHGPDFYASQTWSDVPDGRRIMTSWMYNWSYKDLFPGRPGGGLTIPVALSLQSTPNGPRVFQSPVKELAALRCEPVSLTAVTLAPGETPLNEVQGRQLEIIAVFENKDATEFGVRVLQDKGGVQTTAGYDAKAEKVFIDRHASGHTELTNFAGRYEAPLKAIAGRITLHLFVDWSSVELLANGGREAITCLVLPPATANGVALYAIGGEARLVSLEVYPLKSVWRDEVE